MSNKCLTIKTLGSVNSDNFHVGEIRITGIAPKGGGVILDVKSKGDYNIECNLPMRGFNGVGDIAYQPLEKDTPYTFKVWNVLNAGTTKIYNKGFTNVEFFEKDNHDIESLQYYSLSLKELDLNNTNISGDIKNLSTLVNLTSLRLYLTNISGDIKNLSTLVNFKELWLYNTNISGDIKNLSTLVNLTDLRLNNTNISGDIKNLSTLVNLTSLNLNLTNVSGDIKDLSTLVNLTSLNLNLTNVSGDIKDLSTLVNLAGLQLSKNVDMSTHLKDFLIALYNSGRNGKDLHLVKESTEVAWRIGSGVSSNYNVKFSENTIILQDKWSDNPKTYLTGTKGGDGNWTWVES